MSVHTGFPVPRAGVHHGPAVERGGDVFGAAVNLAARVTGQAAGDQVVVTASVVAAATELGLEVVSLGRRGLRNLAEPVELFDGGDRAGADGSLPYQARLADCHLT